MSERLTPEEAKALVEKHGSQRQAAFAAGIPRSTFRRRLDPTAEQEEQARYAASRRQRYADDPEYRSTIQEYNREKYWTLSGYEYSRMLLKGRRVQALRRMRKREQRRQEENNGQVPTQG